MAWSPPPCPPGNHRGRDFWAHLRSFNDEQPGRGTDHINTQPAFPFAFGPAEAAALFGARGPLGPGGPHPGPAGGHPGRPHGRRGSRRCRRCSRDDACHSGDEEEAAGLAEGADAERDEHVEASGLSEEKQDSPSTARNSPEGDKDTKGPPGPGQGPRRGPHDSQHGPRRCREHHGHHEAQFWGPYGGPFFGGPFRGRGFGRGGPFGFGPGARHHGHQQPLDAWLGAFASHPLVQQVGQQVRDYLGPLNINAPAHSGADFSANNGGGKSGDDDDVESFTPPVDVFETEGPGGAWVLHIAIPGAKKEDVGISWRAEQGLLTVSGVVYRPGDESFQRGLVSGERRVGLFKRDVRLPPASWAPPAAQRKEEIDADGITARLEDGVLIVTVPRVEKDGWTEVRKVDIIA